MNQFVTAAALTSFTSKAIFASARVGEDHRQAPLRDGFDPTAPLDRSGVKKEPHYLNRHSRSIDQALKIALVEEEKNRHSSAPIHNEKKQNRTMTTTSRTTETSGKRSRTKKTRNSDLDLGILSPNPTHVSSMDAFDTKKIHSENQNRNPTPTPSSTCMMGYDKDQLQEADGYVKHMLAEGNFDSQLVLFDEKSNTIFCMQENDMNEDGDYTTFGCANMHFSGCETVKCNGKASCFGTTIEHAKRIECEGYESCRNSHLDADTVDCGGESACMGARIGTKQLVRSLDCHDGESTCAYAYTASIETVYCTGPLSCYGAALHGVTHSVSCQGVRHPKDYYSPTCGGGMFGSIVAAPGSSIDVVCDGDFSCIGNGKNDKKMPVSMPIDVGGGSLTCGGSLVGNQDGFTFTCRYIDVVQGCSSYECMAPSFAFADHAMTGVKSETLRTCEHVFSIGHNELCSVNDRPNDNADDFEDEDFDDEEDGNDSDDDNDDDEGYLFKKKNDSDNDDDDDEDNQADPEDRRSEALEKERGDRRQGVVPSVV